MQFKAVCSLVITTLISSPALAQADAMKRMNHAEMKTKAMNMQEWAWGLPS